MRLTKILWILLVIAPLSFMLGFGVWLLRLLAWTAGFLYAVWVEITRG